MAPSRSRFRSLRFSMSGTRSAAMLPAWHVTVLGARSRPKKPRPFTAGLPSEAGDRQSCRFARIRRMFVYYSVTVKLLISIARKQAAITRSCTEDMLLGRQITSSDLELNHQHYLVMSTARLDYLPGWGWRRWRAPWRRPWLLSRQRMMIYLFVGATASAVHTLVDEAPTGYIYMSPAGARRSLVDGMTRSLRAKTATGSRLIDQFNRTETL
jgi:hypothetical protein